MGTVPFNDFSAGLWLPGEPGEEVGGTPTEQPGQAMPQTSLRVAENVGAYLVSGGVSGRRGRMVWLDGPPLPGRVRTIFRHYELPTLDSDGPSGDATAINYSGAEAVGSAIWYDLDRIQHLGDGAKVNLLGGTVSLYLACMSLGLAIPGDSEVTGIQVEVFRAQGAGGAGAVRDAHVRLIKAGNVVGLDKANTALNWTQLVNRAVYGQQGDLWGVGWVPADFGPGFGVAISATSTVVAEIAIVSSVRVTVYFTAVTEPRTIFCYYNDAAGTQEYQHRVGTTPGAATPVGNGTGYIQSQRPHFVTWPAKRKSFVFDGENPLLAYDGHKLEEVVPAEGGLPPRKGRASCLWKNRLWATEPAEANFSVYGTDIDDETFWPPDVQLALNDPQGGVIGALEGLQDRLIAFKTTTLWYFAGDPQQGGQLTQYSDDGCVAFDTVDQVPNGIVYLGRHGLLLTDGLSPVSVELSEPVRSLFVTRHGVNVYPNAVGRWFPRRSQYWLKLDQAQPDGWVVHRREVPGDQGPQVQWLWSHFPVLPMECAGVWDGEQDKGQILLGTTDGRILQADEGATDVNFAAGPGLGGFDPIPCVIETQSRTADDVDRRARVYRIAGNYRGRKALSVQLRYDNATELLEPHQLGADLNGVPVFQFPRATVTDFEHFGRSVSIRVENPGDGPEYELHHVLLDMKRKGRRGWEE